MNIKRGMDMLFVTYCENEPIFEVLPVLKTAFYTGGFKPVTYIRAAVEKERGMWIDFMKFERDPCRDADSILESSCVAAAVNFFPGEVPDTFLSIVSDADGRNIISKICGWRKQELPASPEPYSYRGADEQGWYWGVRFLMDAELLNTVYGQSELRPGDCIAGNFYTFSKSGKPHFGSVAPVIGESVFEARNLTALTLSGT